MTKMAIKKSVTSSTPKDTALLSDPAFNAVSLLLNDLKNRHQATDHDILRALQELPDAPKTYAVPLSLLSSRKLGMLEVTVKYLKENKKLSLRDIAGLLNRDSRTIWSTYDSARKKEKKIFRPKPHDEEIPVERFCDRRLGPAECVVTYLKDTHHLRLSQIATLLKRDPRTMWIMYHNGKKKTDTNDTK